MHFLLLAFLKDACTRLLVGFGLEDFFGDPVTRVTVTRVTVTRVTVTRVTVTRVTVTRYPHVSADELIFYR